MRGFGRAGSGFEILTDPAIARYCGADDMEPTRGKTDAIRFEPRDGTFLYAGAACVRGWLRRLSYCMMPPDIRLAVDDNSA